MSEPLDDAALSALAHDLRAAVGRLRRELRDHGGRLGLTPGQVAALGHVYRDGPLTVSALARAEGVRPQSMGATVASLAEAGLVTVAPDPDDRRQRVVTATEVADEKVTASRAVREDWLASTVRDRLTPAEQQTLRDATDLLARLVGR